MGEDVEARAAALSRLPSRYSSALRLRDFGVPRELVADCLEVEPEGLDPLLQVAEAKLTTRWRKN